MNRVVHQVRSPYLYFNKCLQIQREIVAGSGAVMFSSVFDSLCSVFNSFYDADKADPATLVVTKDANDATHEINFIAAFVDKFLDLTAPTGVVWSEGGKRTTSFPGTYLTLCLTPVFRLTGSDRWHRTGALPATGPASAEQLTRHSKTIAERVSEGYNYLKSQAQLPPDRQSYVPEKYNRAKGLIYVMANMVACAMGVTLYCRTEDPTQSIKLLAAGKASYASIFLYSAMKCYEAAAGVRRGIAVYATLIATRL